MTVSSYILFASTAACIIWTLWRRINVTTISLDVPLIEFGDGDESTLRYTNETGKLLKKGYDKVCSVIITSLPKSLRPFPNHHTQHLKNGHPFHIQNIGNPKRPLVFLPLQYMEEVRNAPQDKLSLPLYTEWVRHTVKQYHHGPHLQRSDRVHLGLYSEPHQRACHH